MVGGMMEEVSIVCHYGGKIMMYGHNLEYEGGVTEPIFINKCCTYNDLLTKMYEITGWDQTISKILIKCKFPTNGSNYVAIEIKDDNSTKAMLGLFPRVYSIELFLEREPLDAQRYEVNDQDENAPTLKQNDQGADLSTYGPLDTSVLYDQKIHRSETVWRGQDPGALVCTEHFTNLGTWPLDDRIRPYVRRAGLLHLAMMRWIKLDRALITALVERWRRETQTFHLTFGEITITLQDVAILLGLSVDGDAVTGTTVFDDWAAVAHRCLGIAPDTKELKGGRVTFTWLHRHFHLLPQGASEEVVQQHARAYSLHLIGSTIFADNSGSHIHLMYLPLFTDFDCAGRYAWGSAALAFLYRELSKGCLSDTSGIAGCLTLLQIWAWERLHVGRPRLTVDQIAIDGPLGSRWNVKRKKDNNPHGVLNFYRAELDYQRSYQISWQPYTEDKLRGLPDLCTKSAGIWRSRTPLICFEIVEMHVPDRVMLQFGLEQHTPPEAVERIDRITRQGRPSIDWASYHADYVRRWDKRSETVVHGETATSERAPSSPYMQWYLIITRRLILPIRYLEEMLYQPRGPSEIALLGAVRQVITHLGGVIADGITAESAISSCSYVHSYLGAVLQSLPTLSDAITFIELPPEPDKARKERPRKRRRQIKTSTYPTSPCLASFSNSAYPTASGTLDAITPSDTDVADVAASWDTAPNGPITFTDSPRQSEQARKERQKRRKQLIETTTDWKTPSVDQVPSSHSLDPSFSGPGDVVVPDPEARDTTAPTNTTSLDILALEFDSVARAQQKQPRPRRSRKAQFFSQPLPDSYASLTAVTSSASLSPSTPSNSLSQNDSQISSAPSVPPASYAPSNPQHNIVSSSSSTSSGTTSVGVLTPNLEAIDETQQIKCKSSASPQVDMSRPLTDSLAPLSPSSPSILPPPLMSSAPLVFPPPSDPLISLASSSSISPPPSTAPFTPLTSTGPSTSETHLYLPSLGSDPEMEFVSEQTHIDRQPDAALHGEEQTADMDIVMDDS